MSNKASFLRLQADERRKEIAAETQSRESPSYASRWWTSPFRVMSILFVVLALAGCLFAGLQWYLLQEHLIPKQRFNEASERLSRAAMQLSNHLDSTVRWQNRLVNQPMVMDAIIKAQQTDDATGYSQLIPLLPGASSVTGFTRIPTQREQRQLGYAITDQITKTFQSGQGSIIAMNRQGDVKLAIASPVLSGDFIQAVLLVFYEQEWINGWLSLLGDDQSNVRIWQQVSSQNSNVVEIIGEKPEGDAEYVTDHFLNDWFVAYNINSNINDAWLDTPILWLPWFVAILGLLLVGLIMPYWMETQFRQDQYRWLRFTRRVRDQGLLDVLPEFRWKLFKTLALQAQHLIITSDGKGRQQQRLRMRKHHDIAIENSHSSGDGIMSGEENAFRQPMHVSLERTIPGRRKAISSARVSSIPTMEVSEIMGTDTSQPVEQSLHSASSPVASPQGTSPQGTPPQGTSPQVVPAHIFRAYDIRGKADSELIDALVIDIGRVLGSMVIEAGMTEMTVAWDGRLSSPRLSRALIKGIVAVGCNVETLGACHTGLLYYATHQKPSGCGVMITGSHNPVGDNGFKVLIDKLPLSESAIQDVYHRVVKRHWRNDPRIEKGRETVIDLTEQYCRDIEADIVLARPLKVVIDAGNGIAGPIAKSLLTELGLEITPLYCEVDGHFPNHHPDPSIAANLTDLSNKVRELGADIGLAFDGDGDRVALVDHQGQVVSADHCLMLLIMDILPRHPGQHVVFDVKSSRHFPSLITRLGGRHTMWKTGHSLMKQKMQEMKAVIGGEFSGHFYIGERWYGFDDGIYTAVRLLEILSMSDKTLAQRVAELPSDTSTDEITISTSDSEKFQILAKLAQDDELLAGARVSVIDGVRLEFPDGWGLIRASNTTPKLTLRFAGDSDTVIQTIQRRILEALVRAAPHIDIPSTLYPPEVTS